MLAHHPITGNPIRIMKTETHIYKNKKTLAWLRSLPSETPNAHRFQRWTTVVDSIEYAEAWNTQFDNYPSAILLTNPSKETLQWIRTKAPRQRFLLFLNKPVMDAYGIEQFSNQKFANVICLEEMAEMYPHVAHNYQKDESTSITICMIAAIFRVKRLVGFTQEELDDSSFQLYANKLQEAYTLTCHGPMEPEPLVLLQQYYEPTQSKRLKELRKCLQENLKNPYIDSIILLNEKDYLESLPNHPKLGQQLVGHRLTYADVMLFIQTKVPADTIVVFANADIYLDKSWNQLWSLDLQDLFLSLLRYEESTTDGEPSLFGPRPDSQDTWVIHSNTVQSRTWKFESLQFEFGKAGCDNAINVELLKQKCRVANPSLSLKTIHCHGSAIRTYDPKDVVEKPMFLYLEPTGLHDLRPLHAIQGYEIPWNRTDRFSRRIHSASEQSLKTFCSMVTRQEIMTLSADSDNLYVSQQADRVYRFPYGFTTPSGLVYGYDSIYMGDQPAMREAWATTTISHMTPCIGVKSVLAAPLPDCVSSNLFRYFQEYLARIFRLKAEGYEGDFWMPRDTPRLQEFMQFFKWKEQVMPVIPKDQNIVAYSEKAYLLTPRTSTLCQKEDVEALRSMLRPYVETSSNPRKVVVFQDDTFFSSNDTLAIEASLEELGYEVSVVYPERSTPSYILTRTLDTSICITGPGYESLFWLLPRGARVIECMSELQIVGEGAHTAGACSLEYWVILMARAKADIRLAQLLQKLKQTLDARPIVESTESAKPLLIVPKGFDGIHSHTGDSFREMAALWFSKGYVELEYTTESPYVWLGGIGETLLYDRANYNWLQQTPATYKRLLVGNPDASQLPGAIQWSFWPRRPALVEQKLEQPLPTYEERTDTLVFYGKIENAVQESHRNNTLHEACDEFSMPVGVDKQYMFDQQTYLDKLANAKFGLCMAGFGPKCNREIECMALGTVPVVAPDVDMTNYAVPPQEGVHYIRLKSFDPQDAQAEIATMSKAVWEQMSASAQAWWKANASSDGLWALTRKLSQQLVEEGKK